MSITAASLKAIVTAETSGMESGFDRAALLVEKFGGGLEKAGKAMTAALTVPIVAGAALSGRALIGLDREMRNIQSISKETDEATEALRRQFVAISTDITKTTDSADELARGFYDIQSSGFAGEGAMKVLLASTKAATAGLSTTAVAAKAVTATLNAYGKSADEAQRISDIMFKTVENGVLTFEQLGGSLSNVLSTSASANISFETISAAIATMTKQSMSASESTTALNQLILEFIKPSKEMSKALREIGYESGQAALDGLGLAGTLGALEAAGYNTTERLAGLFGNVRALRAALALTGTGAKLFAADLEAMANASGATQSAFDTQTKSIELRIQSATNKLRAFGMGMVEVLLPSFEKLLEQGSRWLDNLLAMDEAQQQSTANMLLFAAALGPATMGFAKLLDIGTKAVWLVKTLGGAAGLATAAAGMTALGLAAGSAAAVWAVWNSEVKKTVDQGQAAVEAGWEQFFRKTAEAGMDASQAAAQFVEKQEHIQKAVGGTNTLVAQLMNLNKDSLSDYEGLSRMLQAVAKDYDEYRAALEYVAEANDLVIDAQGNLVTGANRAAGTYGGAVGHMVQQNFLMEESIFRLEKANENYIDELVHLGRVSAGVASVVNAKADAIEAFEAALEEAQVRVEFYSGQLGNLEQAMRGMNLTGFEQARLMQEAAMSLGLLTQEQAWAQQSSDLLAEAFRVGVIDLEQWIGYVEEAADANGVLDGLTRSALERTIAAAQAYDEAAQAAERYTLNQLSLAQALKGATEAQFAQTAISELGKLREARDITFEDYVTAVSGVQQAFGLVDDKSEALATNLLGINKAMGEGTLPAENYAKALKEVWTAGAEGDLDEILETFGNMPDLVETATGMTDTYAERLAAMGETAGTAADDVITAFTEPDWSGVGDDVGLSISDGIAAGITAGTPAIEAAAVAAVNAALAAAREAAGIESPSKEWARKVGIPMMQGVAGGIREGARYPLDTIGQAVPAMTQTAYHYTTHAPVTLQGTVNSELDMVRLARMVAEEIRRMGL